MARANPSDTEVFSLSLDRSMGEQPLNHAIEEFFAGVSQFGVMAQQFGWEEKAVIGWVQRNVWLVSAVEHGGPHLICIAYNDTDEPQRRTLDDPPMMGFDNAGLVRGWIGDGDFQPLAIHQSDSPFANRLATRHMTDHIREKAQNQ